MREVLIFFGKVIVNVLIIAFAQMLYYMASGPIIRLTDNIHGPYILFFVPILLIGLYLFFKNKKTRPFGVGLTWLYMSCMVFLFFYINRSWSSPGEFETFKLRHAQNTEYHNSLNIAFSEMYNRTEVSLDKCFDVDSVQVRRDNGFFGLKTMSDVVRLAERTDCQPYTFDAADSLERQLEIGVELFYKRCFEMAIHHYSNTCTLYPSNPYCRYYRGNVFMAKGDYENALNDFVNGARLTYGNLDPSTIDSVDHLTNKANWEALLTKIENDDYADLGESIRRIYQPSGYAMNLRRIKFCLDKIKANQLQYK